MISPIKSISNVQLVLELLLLNVSFILSAVLAQSWDILLQRKYMFILEILLNVIWFFSVKEMLFYEDLLKNFFSSLFLKTVKNSFIQAAVSVLFIFILKENLFTRNFILFHAFFSTFFISVEILVFKYFLLRQKERGINLRNICIIGDSEAGVKFYEMLKKNHGLGYNLIGFINNNYPFSDEKYLGSLNQLEDIIRTKNIDEAVISLTDSDQDTLSDIIKTFNKFAVRIYLIPDYFKFLSKKFQVGMIGNFPIITIRNEPLEEIQWKFLKRTFDIIISLLILVLITSWLFPVIGIIQKLNSRGAIFFSQYRVGKKNKPFRCYKFRTMYTHNEENGYNPTIKSDPRILPFGKFLRRSNLDELPQILNVIKGDMSLVGPRPHSIAFDLLYSQYIEEIRLRNLIKPGITGWAQINGLRGDVIDPIENEIRTKKRIEHDIWYIENWSFRLDLEIILRTLWQMVKADTKGY
jgi:putative colanic acid biosysnthesis UDP-glucose lipid carrier transferase